MDARGESVSTLNKEKVFSVRALLGSPEVPGNMGDISLERNKVFMQVHRLLAGLALSLPSHGYRVISTYPPQNIHASR